MDDKTLSAPRHERYINPYTDFGFKKLFGTEFNKDLLISFLNALFDGKEVISDVTYLPTEQMGGFGDRRAIFDVYCENEKGEKFIVEMQKTEQDYFKDRSIYYATFPIQQQAQRGSDWNFELKSVYTIAVLNFVFPDDEYDNQCLHHEVKLMDRKDKHVFFDKLTFIYLEMPKFNKSEDELETMFDKWLFVLRNLSRLLDRPAALQERIFTKLFEQAEIARFTPSEVQEYQESVKIYRDLKNSMDTAHRKGMDEGIEVGLVRGREEGRAEGLAEGRAEGIFEGERKAKQEFARRLKQDGLSIEIIAKYTGLSVAEIESL